MTAAALWCVLQLLLLSWPLRSSGWPTVLLAFGVGAYGCGVVTVLLELFAARQLAAAHESRLSEVLATVTWTTAPPVEELVKIAPLLLAVWAMRGRIQWGLTDFVVLGGAVGAGFALLESVLAYAFAPAAQAKSAPYGQSVPYGQSAPYGQWMPYGQSAPHGESAPYEPNGSQNNGRDALSVLLSYGLLRFPWTWLIALRYARQRRALFYAAAHPRTRPTLLAALRDDIATRTAHLDATATAEVWRGLSLRQAWRRGRSTVTGTGAGPGPWPWWEKLLLAAGTPPGFSASR
ncbi:PrsW family glutamic-type intramembrane protease [Streptomyces sp. NPDC093085]|uniref:PrsW family glutamic-type intramembrane protease n=1 Tax=Streptomyces sp. NPDC093085 TaxID=3155068 RepID=UPI00343DF5C1